MPNFRLYLLTGFLSLQFSTLFCQSTDDTEFRKGTILLATLNNGLITNFKSTAPDLYAGGVSLNPQFTVIENKLRLGLNAGLYYANKKNSGLFGPMLAWKIKSFEAKGLAGLANLHMLAMANWGTNQQQLVGGGLGFELLTLVHLGLTAQRDYHLNSWWMQSHISIRLNKKKFKEPDFNQPLINP